MACEVEERVREQHIEVREILRGRAVTARERAIQRAGVIGVRAQPVPLRVPQRAEQIPGELLAQTVALHPCGASGAIVVETRENHAFGQRLSERGAVLHRE